MLLAFICCFTLFLFKSYYLKACHANAEAELNLARSSSYIFKENFLKLLNILSNSNVLIWTYKHGIHLNVFYKVFTTLFACLQCASVISSMFK